VFDQKLRFRSQWLRDPDHDVVATPPLPMGFDLLYVAGRNQPWGG
jgi:hypothetical protein